MKIQKHAKVFLDSWAISQHSERDKFFIMHVTFFWVKQIPFVYPFICPTLA